MTVRPPHTLDSRRLPEEKTRATDRERLPAPCALAVLVADIEDACRGERCERNVAATAEPVVQLDTNLGARRERDRP